MSEQPKETAVSNDIEIIPMTIDDKTIVVEMMDDFYSSPAVATAGSIDIFESNVENCVSKDNPLVEGYILKYKGEVAGYTMIAKSFTTEFAKYCLWLEDLYLKSDFRGKGIIPYFLKFLQEKYPDYMFKLEVENENEHAVHVYKKYGFESFPYFVMHT